ncbi:MAG TPA: FKBP-type peptidyl-prolyl cis-trans isomerase [Candidatus Thermoplasmatota archaeon]|nr:FKBP-type peptidyl-prolyl cis-trans isomerase [Candidatus Thermoplasmatota archaeon]
MSYSRATAASSVVLALSILLSGCLAGPAPVPKVSVSLLTDAEVVAQPGWTVGWALEAFESIGDNQTVALSTDAPGSWNARFLNASLNISKANGRHTTFLLADVPSDLANGTYPFKVFASLGADRAEAAASLRVVRPLLNLVKNGTVVKIDYVGFLADNRVFDTSVWSVANSSGLEKWPDFVNSSAVRTQADYNPLQVTVGNRQVIAGWESGLQGTALGNGKALVIPADQAYGRFVNQSVNLTLAVPIYNTTTAAAFKPMYGADPVRDQQYVEPVFGWTVQVVSVDNATGVVVLHNLPNANASYTPYGVNATVSNISSAAGNFEVRFAPEAGFVTHNRFHEEGVVVEINATAFTVRWQTEHTNKLAPYDLYFLIYVRSAAG